MQESPDQNLNTQAMVQMLYTDIDDSQKSMIEDPTQQLLEKIETFNSKLAQGINFEDSQTSRNQFEVGKYSHQPALTSLNNNIDTYQNAGNNSLLTHSEMLPDPNQNSNCSMQSCQSSPSVKDISRKKPERVSKQEREQRKRVNTVYYDGCGGSQFQQNYKLFGVTNDINKMQEHKDMLNKQPMSDKQRIQQQNQTITKQIVSRLFVDELDRSTSRDKVFMKQSLHSFIEDDEELEEIKIEDQNLRKSIKKTIQSARNLIKDTQSRQQQLISQQTDESKKVEKNLKTKHEKLNSRQSSSRLTVQSPRDIQNLPSSNSQNNIVLLMEVKTHLDSCKKMLNKLIECRTMASFNRAANDILSQEQQMSCMPVKPSMLIQDLKALQDFIQLSLAKTFYQATLTQPYYRSAQQSIPQTCKSYNVSRMSSPTLPLNLSVASKQAFKRSSPKMEKERHAKFDLNKINATSQIIRSASQSVDSKCSSQEKKVKPQYLTKRITLNSSSMPSTQKSKASLQNAKDLSLTPKPSAIKVQQSLNGFENKRKSTEQISNAKKNFNQTMNKQHHRRTISFGELKTKNLKQRLDQIMLKCMNRESQQVIEEVYPQTTECNKSKKSSKDMQSKKKNYIKQNIDYVQQLSRKKSQEIKTEPNQNEEVHQLQVPTVFNTDRILRNTKEPVQDKVLKGHIISKQNQVKNSKKTFITQALQKASAQTNPPSRPSELEDISKRESIVAKQILSQLIDLPTNQLFYFQPESNQLYGSHHINQRMNRLFEPSSILTNDEGIMNILTTPDDRTVFNAAFISSSDHMMYPSSQTDNLLYSERSTPYIPNKLPDSSSFHSVKNKDRVIYQTSLSTEKMKKLNKSRQTNNQGLKSSTNFKSQEKLNTLVTQMQGRKSPIPTTNHIEKQYRQILNKNGNQPLSTAQIAHQNHNFVNNSISTSSKQPVFQNSVTENKDPNNLVPHKYQMNEKLVTATSQLSLIPDNENLQNSKIQINQSFVQGSMIVGKSGIDIAHSNSSRATPRLSQIQKLR
eukprot:403344894